MAMYLNTIATSDQFPVLYYLYGTEILYMKGEIFGVLWNLILDTSGDDEISPKYPKNKT